MTFSIPVLSAIMMSTIMLSVVMLRLADYFNVMLSVVMLNGSLLSVVMLNGSLLSVAMLNVVMLSVARPYLFRNISKIEFWANCKKIFKKNIFFVLLELNESRNGKLLLEIVIHIIGHLDHKVRG